MTKTISAVFERGVFRPTEPVDLTEGTEVAITLTAPDPADERQNIGEVLAEIAKLADPSAEPNDGLSGSRDHDKILYGGPKGAL